MYLLNKVVYMQQWRSLSRNVRQGEVRIIQVLAVLSLVHTSSVHGPWTRPWTRAYNFVWPVFIRVLGFCLPHMSYA